MIGKLCMVTAIVGVGMVCQSTQASAKSYQDKLTVAGDKVKQIDMKTASWDVEISESDSSEVNVSVEGKQRNKKIVPVTMKQKDKCLVIEQKEQDKGMFGGFSFGVEGTISIKVPKGKLAELTIQNKSGDLTINQLSADKIVIDNQEGEEHLAGLTANSASFQSNDGDISLRDSEIKALTVRTTSGELTVDGVTSDDANVLSKESEIIIRNAVEGKKLNVESSTGDVNISYKKVPTSLSVSASTGAKDLEIGLDKFKVEKGSNGSKKGLVGKGENSLKVKSDKGTVSIK